MFTRKIIIGDNVYIDGKWWEVFSCLSDGKCYVVNKIVRIFSYKELTAIEDKDGNIINEVF